MTAVRTGVLGLVDSSSPDQGPQRSPAPPGPRRLGGWVKAHWAGIALLLPVLVLVGAVHAWGMHANPQRLDDEGTYVSQAWAVMHWTTLAHYTYWYDHPPFGWILVALYSAVTGAFSRAPNAVAAGRELMLILQLVSATLLYVLTRRLGLRRVFATGAVLLFSLSRWPSSSTGSFTWITSRPPSSWPPLSSPCRPNAAWPRSPGAGCASDWPP